MWNPHPPTLSPAGEGEQNPIIFLFPSPAGATVYTQVGLSTFRFI
jgi:hypothetical protein